MLNLNLNLNFHRVETDTNVKTSIMILHILIHNAKKVIIFLDVQALVKVKVKVYRFIVLFTYDVRLTRLYNLPITQISTPIHPPPVENKLQMCDKK